MAETVFILGAGASKEAGAPVMSEFIQSMQELPDSVLPNDLRKVRSDLMKTSQSMGDLVARMKFSSTNIEDLLGIVEVADILGALTCWPELDVKSLLKGLRRLIAITLEESIHYPVVYNGTEFHIVAPGPYLQLANLIRDAFTATTVSIISLNYDVAMDYALEDVGTGCHYALPDSTQGVMVLKLHGSTNWSQCTKCHRIVAVPVRKTYDDGHVMRHGWMTDTSNHDPIHLQMSRKLASATCPECKTPLSEEPFICAPTWNKMTSREWIATEVWKRASSELAAAKNVFVIGYSMPKTDQILQALLANGLSGRDHPVMKRFWVFDPLQSTGDRYDALVGPMMHEIFQFKQAPFSKVVQVLRKEVWIPEGWLQK